MQPLISPTKKAVQFCTLLQVPLRLHGDSMNLTSFTTFLHL
jgi:hypothetical protein